MFYQNELGGDFLNEFTSGVVDKEVFSFKVFTVVTDQFFDGGFGFGSV